ncbi:MAG: glycosyltransferase [Acidimicrobiia bacterium]
MPVGDLVSLVVRLLAGCWLLWAVRRPADHGEGASRPPCSIVVPARDEAGTLPALLRSVVPQLAAGDELVVVDDHSGDATATVAAAGGATVVPAPELPPGWTGKAWACWTGAAAARGDVLVFLDADVTMAAGGLGRALAEHRDRCPDGLLSVQPYHVTVKPYERASALFNVVAMMGTDAFTPRGDAVAPRGAFGPCLVTTRDAYEVAGGHEAVRSSVLDDVALSQRYIAAGRHVVCRGGRGTVSFRMYPRGWRQLLEGWSKNLAGGAGATRVPTTLLVVAWVSLLIQAAWWAVGYALTGDGPGSGPWFTVTAYGAVVAQLAWMLRRVGRFGPITPLLFPLPLVAFLFIFTRSVYLTVVRRKVTWKGRAIET